MKMSREGLWEPWQGMWLSSFIILPLGVFLTYKATIDAQLFNSESWANAFKEIGHFFVRIFKKLSDTGDSKEQHPLRNNLQVAAFICGGIGFGLAFTPMFLTSLTFAIAAIAMGVGVIFLNRKYNFKSKFATLAIAIGVAGLVFCLLNGNKRAKKHAQAVEEDMPQTEQVLQQ